MAPFLISIPRSLPSQAAFDDLLPVARRLVVAATNWPLLHIHLTSAKKNRKPFMLWSCAHSTQDVG